MTMTYISLHHPAQEVKEFYTFKNKKITLHGCQPVTNSILLTIHLGSTSKAALDLLMLIRCRGGGVVMIMMMARMMRYLEGGGWIGGGGRVSSFLQFVQR